MMDYLAMPSPVVHAVTLARHPESRAAAVGSVGARVCRDADGTLAITYSIEGDCARLRIPPPRTPRSAHGLWRHTCCECFIAFPGRPGYHELNFAPSSEWAAYAFAEYREDSRLAVEALNPRIVIRGTAERIEIETSIPLARLSAAHTHAKLALGLSAVIEDERGMRSYWALRHPVSKPDFHHPDSFVLVL